MLGSELAMVVLEHYIKSPSPKGGFRRFIWQNLKIFLTGYLRDCGDWDYSIRAEGDNLQNIHAMSNINKTHKNNPKGIDISNAFKNIIPTMKSSCLSCHIDIFS
jgi:hypothetical protein